MTNWNPVLVTILSFTHSLSNMAMARMLSYMLKTYSLYSDIVPTFNFSEVNTYVKTGKAYITESRNVNTVVV